MTNEIETTERWTISVRSDYAVLRYDPEYAEYGNPRGEIYGEVFYLRATNAYGNTREWGLGWLEEAPAEAAIADAPPVETWTDGLAVYGTQAWVDYGESDEVAKEMEEREAEGWR